MQLCFEVGDSIVGEWFVGLGSRLPVIDSPDKRPKACCERYGRHREIQYYLGSIELSGVGIPG